MTKFYVLFFMYIYLIGCNTGINKFKQNRCKEKRIDTTKTFIVNSDYHFQAKRIKQNLGLLSLNVKGAINCEQIHDALIRIYRNDSLIFKQKGLIKEILLESGRYKISIYSSRYLDLEIFNFKIKNRHHHYINAKLGNSLQI